MSNTTVNRTYARCVCNNITRVAATPVPETVGFRECFVDRLVVGEIGRRIEIGWVPVPTVSESLNGARFLASFYPQYKSLAGCILNCILSHQHQTNYTNTSRSIVILHVTYKISKIQLFYRRGQTNIVGM